MISSAPRLILMLAVLAVMLRAFIPTGYMPDLNGGKVFHMTICTLEGPKTIAVDNKMHPVSEKHEMKEKCEFSLLGHTPFKNEAVVLALPVLTVATQKLFIKDQILRRSGSFVLAQPRGPPVV